MVSFWWLTPNTPHYKPRLTIFNTIRPLNNSLVYGTDGFCDAVVSGWSKDGCMTIRGGAYDPDASSSQKKGTSTAFAKDSGFYGGVNYPTNLTAVFDSFFLVSNLTLDSFPLSIVRSDWGAQGYHPQAALGLGPNSTLLSVLVDSSTIAL